MALVDRGFVRRQDGQGKEGIMNRRELLTGAAVDCRPSDQQAHGRLFTSDTKPEGIRATAYVGDGWIDFRNKKGQCIHSANVSGAGCRVLVGVAKTADQLGFGSPVYYWRLYDKPGVLLARFETHKGRNWLAKRIGKFVG